MTEVIISVAVKMANGLILSLPAPARHHNVIHIMSDLDIYKTDEANHEQGFLTSTGRFVDRKEAFEIAEREDQILDIENTRRAGLFSEDLW